MLNHKIKILEQSDLKIFHSATYDETLQRPSVFEFYRSDKERHYTKIELENKLAALEGSKYCLALNSGVTAISSVFNLLKIGDHLIIFEDVYCATYRYLKIPLERFGL